jgi:hypothetical protein
MSQPPTLPRKLPVVTVHGREYFVDERLDELRAVNNPHDRKRLNTRWDSATSLRTANPEPTA